MPVPDDDMGGRQAGSQQLFDDRGDHGGPRATVRAGGRKDFQTDDVLSRDQAPPALRRGCFAGQVCDGAADHEANSLGPGLESVGGFGVLDDDYFGAGEAGRWGNRRGGHWNFIRDGAK